MSEKASIVGDVRKMLQDFLAPELVEVKTKLQALADGQREMEARLIREIRNSEQKPALMSKNSRQ